MKRTQKEGREKVLRNTITAGGWARGGREPVWDPLENFSRCEESIPTRSGRTRTQDRQTRIHGLQVAQERAAVESDGSVSVLPRSRRRESARRGRTGIPQPRPRDMRCLPLNAPCSARIVFPHPEGARAPACFHSLRSSVREVLPAKARDLRPALGWKFRRRAKLSSRFPLDVPRP